MVKKPAVDLHIRVKVTEIAGSRLADQTQQREVRGGELPPMDGVLPYIVRSRNFRCGLKTGPCRIATRQLSPNHAQDSRDDSEDCTY